MKASTENKTQTESEHAMNKEDIRKAWKENAPLIEAFTETVIFNTTKEQKEVLREVAACCHVTMSHVVRVALDEFFDKLQK